MQAVLLIGHGSLRLGSGAAMLRLAARAREAGVAPIVEAGFLNYSRPTFAEALRRCAAGGANHVIVQPYFLVPGKFVRTDLPRLLEQGRALQPALELTLAEPFGDHPALAGLVRKRAAAAERGRPRDATGAASGLLIVAHGSPDPRANGPVEAIARRVMAQGGYDAVAACYLDLNAPSIDAAIDQLLAQGLRRLIAVPYFLQLGGHVAEDLPAAFAAARARYPAAQILLAEHLSYDPLLVSVIADRARQAA